MANQSISRVLGGWVNDHAWPRGAKKLDSIVVVSAANRDGSTFVLHSAFSHFEISSVYNKNTNSLTNVVIKLKAPSFPKSVVVATAASYPLSARDGPAITFNIDSGFIRGKVAFKYGDYNGQQHIFAAYRALLPFAGEVKKIADIGPTVAEASGLTPAQLQNIQPLESYRPSAQTIDTAEQTLLAKYLKEFSTPNGLAIVTYNKDESDEYYATFYFDIFELVICIDPDNLTFTATLYVDLPFIGRIELVEISATLTEDGIKIEFSVYCASGYIEISIKKADDGNWELVIDVCVDLCYLGEVCAEAEFELPF